MKRFFFGQRNLWHTHELEIKYNPAKGSIASGNRKINRKFTTAFVIATSVHHHKALFFRSKRDHKFPDLSMSLRPCWSSKFIRRWALELPNRRSSYPEAAASANLPFVFEGFADCSRFVLHVYSNFRQTPVVKQDWIRLKIKNRFERWWCTIAMAAELL